MSRIGRRPIDIPAGTSVLLDGEEVRVKGPKGSLSYVLPEEISLKISNGQATLERGSELKKVKSAHGLARSLVANMVQGVTSGYEKVLEIKGVGYRAEVAGRTLNLTLGFSHPVAYEIPDGIQIAIDRQVKVSVTGIDKQLVGAVAAKIRAYRPPDAYKGKGVRYSDEVVRLKAGKARGK